MAERTNHCYNCSKRSNSLLSDLSVDEFKILTKNRYSVSYKSEEIICKEGTKPLGLIYLNKGKVKILQSANASIPKMIKNQQTLYY